MTGRSTLRAAALAVALVALDQGTKAFARANVTRGGEDPILPGISLVNTRNTGVAFGLLEGGGAIVGVVSGLAVAGLLVFFVLHRRRPLVWLPTGLLIGGAVGNLIDRVFRDDGVTDFVKVPLWPAFNVADVAITFGVLALLYVIEQPRERREPAGA